MKKIVSKATVILSIILFTLSICAVTSIECLKGKIPLQNTIINSEDVIDGIAYGDINCLPYKQIPLFYIGPALLIISSIICFEKSNRFKGLVNISLSILSAFFVIITHNYIWFLILINICFILNILFDNLQSGKIVIGTSIITIIIGVINVFKLIKHMQLIFDSSNIQSFYISLIELSDTILKLFILWVIPYTILLIKNIIVTYKALRTFSGIAK